MFSRINCLLPLVFPLNAAEDGAALYQQNCAVCHGATGAGLAGVFPPLANSDFLAKERERALKAPLEGMSGRIEVNGEVYDGAMPPAFLDDDQVAAVFNHIFASWENELAPVTAAEVTRLRATTRFPTLNALKASMAGTELPEAPPGWKLEIGAELSFSPSRLAIHPDGEQVLALSPGGDVWSWKPDGAEMRRLIPSASYIDPKLGDHQVMGMTVDRDGRLYITSNQRNTATNPVMNEMIIFRSGPWQTDQALSPPKAWFQKQSPYGIGPYNHGLSHIAQGPDGLLYINCGARTDSGEAGNQAGYATTGEEPDTAAIWRMDPSDESPAVEIFATGLRNSYGFCWDDQGRMFATENGPDAHCPEELNLIEKGKHYGFPFQYSDWNGKPYPHTPDTPSNLKITRPLGNIGPHGGGNATGLSTFDPHSSPAGIVWLGGEWPEPLANSFLTARFGNMLKLDHDVGFDVLQLKVDADARTVTTRRLLSPLGRPIDIVKLPGQRLVIAEHSRETTLAAAMGTPGRLLLLQPE